MNERIKELLLQAGFTNAYTDPKEGFELVFVDEEHTTESVAKFAELIVQECTDFVQKYMTRWPEDCELTKQIKEHFGVEE